MQRVPIVVRTTPSARLLVDGKDTGRSTPIKSGAALQLPAGKHAITFVLGDGRRFDDEVTVRSRVETRIVRDFTADPKDWTDPFDQ